MTGFKGWSLALAMMALPLIASAQIAYTAKDVHVRAGPNRDYPAVVILGGGSTVDVQGCLSDYSWCDVIAGPNRGWVYARNIVYPYQGNNVPLITYGNALGVAVVTFSIGAYWNNYYRGRPWYGQMSHWRYYPPHHHRPPGYRPGPPPPRPGHHRPPQPVHPIQPPPPRPGTKPAPRPPNQGARPPANHGGHHRPPPGQGQNGRPRP